MKILSILALAGALMAFQFTGVVYAEGGKGAPTPAELGQAIPADQITDKMLDSFVKADRQIREVQIEANQKIFRILEQEGLSVEKYNGIVQAITTNDKILKKVQDKINKILAEENKQQGK